MVTSNKTSSLLRAGLVAATAVWGTSAMADDSVIRIINLPHFHGDLEGSFRVTSATGEKTRLGGVEYIAPHVKQLRAQAAHSVVVSAGDVIGASPPLSGLFHDEPTIKAMDLIGLQYASVASHELDKGLTEFQRIVKGGCHPDDDCAGSPAYQGTRFRYLAANIALETPGDAYGIEGYKDQSEIRVSAAPKLIAPPYAIKQFGNKRVAIVGVGRSDTKTLTAPGVVDGLQFFDEVKAVNALIPILKAEKADAIVVLIHRLGYAGGDLNAGGDRNGCKDPSGPVFDAARGFSPDVDVVIGGDGQQAFVCRFEGKLVVQGGKQGGLLTAIDISFGQEGKAETTAFNSLVTRDVQPDPALVSLVNEYREKSKALTSRVVGRLKETIVGTRFTATGDRPLGGVIADAYLAATQAKEHGGANFALMNAGGVRADLITVPSTASEGSPVTWADLYAVAPFANDVVTLSLTGQQVIDLLEQQFTLSAGILSVSSNVSYTYDAKKPNGQKVDTASIMIDGKPIDRKAQYRIATNSFLAAGGDEFTVFKGAKDRQLAGFVDLDALVKYFESHSPISAPGTRISKKD